MKKFRSALTALALLLLVPALQMAGCAGPGYYAQAISGHLQLMGQRQEITALLSANDTEPGLIDDLALTMEIRGFASAELGLPDNRSYTQFVRTGRDAVTWNVIAAPQLSLEPRRWCFLVSGCVPYRGYFRQQEALEFAERLSRKGYDVTVSPATAYSTLGWFKDPLLDTMLRHGEEQLAAVMFHELAHQQLYVSGDTAFSESYASFVEDIGMMLWLQWAGRADRLPAWERHQQAARQFDTLLLQTRERLSALYASDTSEAEKHEFKRGAFEQLEADYRQLVDGPWQGQDLFAGWFTLELNNARLALFDSYRGGVCAFAELYRAVGENMERFHAAAAARAALDTAARQAWLNRPCPAVASSPDL
jgi:predicted aminopeptidase